MSEIKDRVEKLREFIRELPLTPGVYLMKSSNDKIIYVGKAKSLRTRVRSYFQELDKLTPKTRLLSANIFKIDFILTKTEVEAFLLEASLIKKHRPKYNIRLKDDKSYPYIRLSMKDSFPRLYLSRKVVKDGSLYFGPYTNGFIVRETIHVLNTNFLLRDCTDHFMMTRKRPCMTHQIGRCGAPCVALVTKEVYAEGVEQVLKFLRGRDKSVLKDIEDKMYQFAEEERFEEAARLRDSVKGLRGALEKQVVVNDKKTIDQDVISFVGDERGTLIETLHIRAGRVVGSRPHFFGHLNVSDPSEDVRDWMSSFLNQYYDENVIPDEVILSVDLGTDILKLLSAVLEERSGKEVKIKTNGDYGAHKLTEMADRNAQEHFKSNVEKSDLKQKGLQEIQKRLDLPGLPIRIECFDISHFQGSETVASQVVFEEGVPSKDHYRRYKLHSVADGDDFGAMKEALARRLKHTEYEDPDLLLIDGGKGQLSAVMSILADLGRTEIPVVSIAKARTQGEFSDENLKFSEERFFIPNRANPVIFRSNSEAFRILVSLRDEAHRFAISYHRKLREASSLQSALDQISGIGEKLKQALFERFPDIEAIRSAPPEELCQVKGISPALAQRIIDELK